MNGIAGNDLVRIGEPPAAVIPISQLQPPDIAAAGLAVLGQMLLRPMASPILQPEFETGRNRIGELDRDLVNLARIVPLDSIAIRQKNAEWRRVKGNWSLGVEMRAHESKCRAAGQPKSEIHGTKITRREVFSAIEIPQLWRATGKML